MHSKGRFQLPQLQGENLKLSDETWLRQSLDTNPGRLIFMIPKTLQRRKHRGMLLPFPLCIWTEGQENDKSHGGGGGA